MMTQKEMDQDHRKIHEELHKSLDMLMADYITYNSDKRFSNTTVMELMLWSHKQTICPEERDE